MITHFSIDPEFVSWFRSQSLWLDTPMHDGRCHGAYMNSVLGLQDMARQWGIRFRVHARHGESLITRARNKNAELFLQSGMTHMLCIDSDIQFDPADALYLLALSRTHPGILGMAYAKKHVNWERIAMAQNHASEYPAEMMPLIGSDPVLNFLPGPHPLHQPDPDVRHLGTGAMLIPRYVFDQLAASGRLDSYELTRPEKVELQAERVTAYFEAKVIDGQYPSEDWYLCDQWRALGGRVWLCPWMKTSHIGSYEYHFDMAAIAATGLEVG